MISLIESMPCDEFTFYQFRAEDCFRDCRRSIVSHVISVEKFYENHVSEDGAWRIFMSFARRKIAKNDFTSADIFGIFCIAADAENSSVRISYEDVAFTYIITHSACMFGRVARLNAIIKQCVSEINDMHSFINERYGCDVASLCIKAGGQDHEYNLSAIDELGEEHDGVRHYISCMLPHLITFMNEYSKTLYYIPSDDYISRARHEISSARKYYILLLKSIAKSSGEKRAFKTNQKLQPVRLQNWTLWQQEADRIREINPTLSREAVYKKVAAKFGVSPRSVRNRVT